MACSRPCLSLPPPLSQTCPHQSIPNPLLFHSHHSCLHQTTSLSNHPDIHFIELPLPTLPGLPPHHHTTNNLPHHLLPLLIQAFQLSKPQFAEILHTLTPDLLIYDAFHPWAAKQAESMGIPAVFFATSGATALSFYHHMDSRNSSEGFPFPGIYLTGYQMRDLAVQGEKIAVDTDGDNQGFAFGAFTLSHDVLLIKTCWEVERNHIEYLSKLCGKTLLPVGPLVCEAVTDASDDTITQWLDGKQRSSVVYISFGSENYLSNDQILEVAKGLELSNRVGFIWVVRSPTWDEGELPEGFVQRTTERGMVLRGWAPQAAILAHPSVGGFMSHCGWSSIMESMYFGVPVLAVPLKLDQPLNCRLVVESGVGVEVGRDEVGKFDGEGVAMAIHEVMVEKGDEMRGRVRAMSDKVRMGEGNEFREAMEELSRLAPRNGV